MVFGEIMPILFGSGACLLTKTLIRNCEQTLIRKPLTPEKANGVWADKAG